MKLFVWNINQQSSVQEIPRFVSKVIMESNADIVVLTEFISAAHKENIGEFIESLSEKYDFRYNEDRDKERRANGILIAVKKGFAEINSPAIERLVAHFSKQDQPNFLQVEIVVDGRPITIIGTRIQIDCKKSQSKLQEVRREEFKERRVQLLSLIEHINTLKNKNIIVAGDFNHARILGDEIAAWSDDDVKKSYFGKDTYDTYNFHMMKDDFTNIGVAVFTPEGKQYSCGFELHGDKPNNGYLKEDHIVTRNLNVRNLKYCHSFIENYLLDKEWNKNWKGKYAIVPPYPDHAILTADVEFLENDPA